MRVTDHCVGRILSGPPELRGTATGHEGRHYEPWASPDFEPLVVIDLYAALPRTGKQTVSRGMHSRRRTRA